jgi:hypothetical protein
MSKSDRILLWVGRVISLPLAGICFYFVWQIWHEWKDADPLAFTAFIASGVFCLVYFFVLLSVHEEKSK